MSAIFTVDLNTKSPESINGVALTSYCLELFHPLLPKPILTRPRIELAFQVILLLLPDAPSNQPGQIKNSNFNPSKGSQNTLFGHYNGSRTLHKRWENRRNPILLESMALQPKPEADSTPFLSKPSFFYNIKITPQQLKYILLRPTDNIG
ncbi:hypothetical protein AVEN_119226-1 [Araneus ventricosus]|uniref:Uncharacterized protein n=1 Tax=Araneus ventricosus TaxID=182803 RepID=A0A4Y2IKW2_ARAVE|nr:hypothetical protein AVEN_119226-1 [Araneus ventricosus]